MIRQVDLEQVKVLVDLLLQAKPLREGMNNSQSPAACRVGAFGHLVMDIAPAEHRFGLITPVGRSQTSIDTGLAIAEDLGVLSVHSRCSFHRLVWS